MLVHNTMVPRYFYIAYSSYNLTIFTIFLTLMTPYSICQPVTFWKQRFLTMLGFSGCGCVCVCNILQKYLLQTEQLLKLTVTKLLRHLLTTKELSVHSLYLLLCTQLRRPLTVLPATPPILGLILKVFVGKSDLSRREGRTRSYSKKMSVFMLANLRFFKPARLFYQIVS